MHTGFLVGKPGGGNDDVDVRSVDGRIILKRVFKKWDGEDMAWIDLVRNRDRWWAYMNAVMNLGVP
jgi:hypothetical protein